MTSNDFGKPRVAVMYGNAENCHDETVHVYDEVGAAPTKILYKTFLENPHIIRDYQVLDLPGGFLDADDMGAAKAMAFRMRNREGVMEEIERFIEKGKLIKGTCNGFQLLVKSGILPGLDGNYRNITTTLTYNDSGRFEDRWVYLDVDGDGKCVWTKGIQRIELPVRHGEGKFKTDDDKILKRLKAEGLIVGRYAGEKGEQNPGYPWNPNGSVEDTAMLCDPTGQVIGVMPHPEAYIKKTNHPRWTRQDLPEEGAGVQIFRNAVEYFE